MNNFKIKMKTNEDKLIKEKHKIKFYISCNLDNNYHLLAPPSAATTTIAPTMHATEA